MEDQDGETRGKKSKRKEYKELQVKPSISAMFLEATNNLSKGNLSPTEIKEYIFNQHNIDITEHLEDLHVLKTRNSEMEIHGRFPNRRQVKSPRVPKSRPPKPLVLKRRQQIQKSNPKRSCTIVSSNYSAEAPRRGNKAQTDHAKKIDHVPVVRNKILNDTRVKTRGNTNALNAVSTECNKEQIALTDGEKDLQLHFKSKDKKHPPSPSTDLQSESTMTKAGSVVKNFIEDLGTKCASSLNYLSIPFTNSPSSRRSKNPTNKMKKTTKDQTNDTCCREKSRSSTRSSHTQTINSLADESGDAGFTNKVKLNGETKNQNSKASKTKTRKKITEKEAKTDIRKKGKPISSGSKSVKKSTKRKKNMGEIDICSVEKDDNTLNSSVCTSDDVMTGDNEMTKITELNDDSFKNRSIVTRRMTRSSAQKCDEKQNETPSTHNEECNKKSKAKRVSRKKK